MYYNIRSDELVTIIIAHTGPNRFGLAVRVFGLSWLNDAKQLMWATPVGTVMQVTAGGSPADEDWFFTKSADTESGSCT